jgi:hypothetical protein
VALSGAVAIVSADADDDIGTDSGSVYVFDVSCGLPGDVDGDGCVDITDFLLLIAAWGPVSPGHPADFDGNGNVGIPDFLALLAGWQPCP